LGQCDKGLDYCQQGLPIIEALVQQHPQDIAYLVAQGRGYACRADILKNARRHDEARTWAARAIPILQGVLQRSKNHPDATQYLKIARDVSQ
jgi:hypothetical protein